MSNSDHLRAGIRAHLSEVGQNRPTGPDDPVRGRGARLRRRNNEGGVGEEETEERWRIRHSGKSIDQHSRERTVLPNTVAFLLLLCLPLSRSSFIFYKFPRGSGQPRMAVCRDKLVTGWTGGTGSKALASVSSQEYPPTFPPERSNLSTELRGCTDTCVCTYRMGGTEYIGRHTLGKVFRHARTQAHPAGLSAVFLPSGNTI